MRGIAGQGPVNGFANTFSYFKATAPSPSRLGSEPRALASGFRYVSVIPNVSAAPRAARSVHLRYQAPESTAFYNELAVEESVPGMKTGSGRPGRHTPPAGPVTIRLYENWNWQAPNRK